MKQMELDAKHRDRLFELAAGVMAARTVPHAGPVNLINGTQIDQTVQAPDERAWHQPGRRVHCAGR